MEKELTGDSTLKVSKGLKGGEGPKLVPLGEKECNAVVHWWPIMVLGVSSYIYHFRVEVLRVNAVTPAPRTM